MSKRISKPIPERILARMRDIYAEFATSTECWEWPKSKNVQTGYGQMGYYEDGKHFVFAAHRVSLVLDKGQPQDTSLCVLHKCDNRGCFNPDHLFWGSQKANMHDMHSKGRAQDYKEHARKNSGENHWSAKLKGRIPVGEAVKKSKLTEKAVIEIRASNETLTVLANRYGVTPTAISYVRIGKTWKHVSPVI